MHAAGIVQVKSENFVITKGSPAIYFWSANVGILFQENPEWAQGLVSTIVKVNYTIS